MGAPIKSASWWMISYAPRETVLAPVIDQAQINALLMMLSLLLIFICASLVSVRITRPHYPTETSHGRLHLSSD